MTKSKKLSLTTDPNRAKAHKMLTDHGYRCNWSVITDPNLCLEHYSGPKGSVILQTYDNHNGVNLYADWAIGHKWTEVEEALKP